MTKIETVNAAMANAPYFALSPEVIAQLRAQTAKPAQKGNGQ